MWPPDRREQFHYPSRGFERRRASFFNIRRSSSRLRLSSSAWREAVSEPAQGAPAEVVLGCMEVS
jgi:hypothetical protein